TSSDAYALRFRGPAGAWFLTKQARDVVALLRPLGPCRVLEAGGGHAQLTGPLLRAGHRVTVQGSSPCCAERVRRLSPAPFVASALERLPFRDGAFDAVVSVRTMAHAADPTAFLRECARVAARAVVVDFPSRRSVNVLADLLFALKRGVEKDTRPYRVFRPAEPDAMIAGRGWRRTGTRAQFFWPMVIHRFHGLPALGRVLEALPALLGLRRLLGSPVLALYRSDARIAPAALDT
ncbi:MAG: class I SAM-dependent methyltransferase, partial [Planctomycetota bacterium]